MAAGAEATFYPLEEYEPRNEGNDKARVQP